MDPAQLTTALAAMTGRPDDPTVRGFAQLLATALRDDGEDEERRARVAERARRRRVAMQQVAQVQRLIQHMSDRNIFVAAALGACECWGADAACERCGGRGVPGTYEPEPSAFATLVLPLLHRRPQLFHPLPVVAHRDAATRDTEPGGGSHAGQPN